MRALIFDSDFGQFVAYFTLGLLVLGLLLLPVFPARRRARVVPYFISFIIHVSRALSLALRRYAIFAVQSWWLILLLLGLGMGVAFWKHSKEPPVYVSEARMVVTGKIDLPEGAVYSEEFSDFYGTQMELIQSGEIQNRAAARVNTAHPEWPAQPVRLSVVHPSGTSVFLLSAAGTDPRYTRAFLEAIMIEYIEFKREMRVDFSDPPPTPVTEQLLRLDEDLYHSEDELAAFEKKDNVRLLEAESDNGVQHLIQLRQQMAALQTEFQTLRFRDLKQKPDPATNSDTADLEKRRAAIAVAMKTLESEIKEWDEKVTGLNQKIADHNRLQSKVERGKALAERLLAIVQNPPAETRSAGQDVVAIQEHASTATETRPGLIKDLVTAAAAGLLCALGIIFVRTLLAERVSALISQVGKLPGPHARCEVPYFTSFIIHVSRAPSLALRSYAIFAVKGWWLILLLLGLGMGRAFWKHSKEPPVYISQARMVVSDKIELPEGQAYAEELAYFFNTQMELMQSSEIRSRAAARVDASHPEWPAQPVHISVVHPSGTSVFLLSAAGTEPRYTQAFLEALMDEYIEFKREFVHYDSPT
jgi:uncharacterized protein involved in exopolysaccharide biosynthesis